MKANLKNPIGHMLQGLAHWMAYRNELSNIMIIEADAVSQAIELLQSNLPSYYVVKREITKTSLPIVGSQKIDLGIKNKQNGEFECLIEFKLADATNIGYVGDVNKLKQIKEQNPSIECLVVILYRKSCSFDSPKNLVNPDGWAKRNIINMGKKNVPVKVRRVCNSFASSKSKKSQKTICLEVI